MTRYRQFCSLARAAELVGERWTLLIVRELLFGPRRFADLVRGLNGISPALLSQRLAHMEEAGLIQRSFLPPPASVPVYELTAHGHALRPAVLELIRWGGRFLFPPRRHEVFEPEWARLALEACARQGPTPECAVGLRVVRGKKFADLRVSGGPQGTRISGDSAAPADAIVTAPVETIFALASGRLSIAEAVKAGRARLDGSPAAFGRFPLLFDMSGAPRKGDAVSLKRRTRKAGGGGSARQHRRRSSIRP